MQVRGGRQPIIPTQEFMSCTHGILVFSMGLAFDVETGLPAAQVFRARVKINSLLTEGIAKRLARL